MSDDEFERAWKRDVDRARAKVREWRNIAAQVEAIRAHRASKVRCIKKTAFPYVAGRQTKRRPTMSDGFQTYLVSYRHEGQEWSLELPATSFEDARRRLSMLALGRVDGVMVAKVPAPLGPIAVALAAIRNALSRYRRTAGD